MVFKKNAFIVKFQQSSHFWSFNWTLELECDDNVLIFSEQSAEKKWD